jgi:hypothetical protein
MIIAPAQTSQSKSVYKLNIKTYSPTTKGTDKCKHLLVIMDLGASSSR